jgi:hypothetical protein
LRKGDDLTIFIVPKVEKIQEPPGTPRAISRLVAENLYLYMELSEM